MLLNDMKITKESILDFPQETLNPNIWVHLDDGSYVLRDDVSIVIQDIVEWAQNTFQIPQMNVNITGSNTSNCYSKNSDIDIHFNSPKLKKDKADDFNKIFREKFEELITSKPELGEVNGIKIEIYMQANPFQDLMSVGCYDFINKRWLVGPEMKDMDFDPYAEYFMKGLKSVDDVIDGVRSIILQMYELSLAVLKSNDQKFVEQAGNKLRAAMSKANKLFGALRKRRSHKSSPKDAKEAKTNRDDKDWKVADSAFKLLDKLGYLGMLKVAAQAIENEATVDDAAKDIIAAITEKISSKALDDSEKEFVSQLQEVEMQNESIGSMMKLSAIAAMMSIGTLLPAASLAKELSKAKEANKTLTINSQATKKAIADAAKDNKMIGQMSKTNAVNAVAQVLWKEARGEETIGRKAVASVILNRADSNPSNIIAVLKEPSAFTCLKGYSGGWTDKTYHWYVPFKAIAENPDNKTIWDDCNSIALDLVDKKFQSTIGNKNAYINKETADKKNVDSWGKKCTLKIGKHHFGYLPEHDPKYVVPGSMTTWKEWNKRHKDVIVVVKSGDTLGKIAKDNKTTVEKILALNKSIKNPDKIGIGQKIRVA